MHDHTIDDLKINVGIPTIGQPLLERRGDCTVLKNMLIGKDFHWQREIEVILPGEISLLSPQHGYAADTAPEYLNKRPDFTLINRLPLEKYLECVIGSEMNPDAPLEFLKAHAVISRSWALGKMAHRKGDAHNEGVTDQIAEESRGEESGKIDEPGLIINWEDTCDHHDFDVCSDDHCQRYQGLQPLPDKIGEAIRATRGLALFSKEERLIDARFSKCCGGRTEVFSSCWQSRKEPSLESFDDPWCDLSGLSPAERENLLRGILKDYDLMNDGGYSWETTVTADEIKENLRSKFGRDIGEIENIRVSERGASGRATRIHLTGTKGSLEIGKELMIRRLLARTHLYSSWIELGRDSSSTPQSTGLSGCSVSTGVPGSPLSRNRSPLYRIKGRGWGHGVGLCQIGAARMAHEGYSFRDILSFYYPGAILRKEREM